MLDDVGYENAIPAAKNLNDAVDAYRAFYSVDDEDEYGVVALGFSIVPTASIID